MLWSDSQAVHHQFQLAELKTGRVLSDTLEIHILQLGRYNLNEQGLTTANREEQWLYWLLHAHEYEPDVLLRLLPDAAICQATKTLKKIAEVSEDKVMYDAREKAIRDQQWQIEASREAGRQEGMLEGEIKGRHEEMIKGEIRLIGTLQELLLLPLTPEAELAQKSLEELKALSGQLKPQLRNRTF